MATDVGILAISIYFPRYAVRDISQQSVMYSCQLILCEHQCSSCHLLPITGAPVRPGSSRWRAGQVYLWSRPGEARWRGGGGAGAGAGAPTHPAIMGFMATSRGTGQQAAAPVAATTCQQHIPHEWLHCMQTPRPCINLLLLLLPSCFVGGAGVLQ